MDNETATRTVVIHDGQPHDGIRRVVRSESLLHSVRAVGRALGFEPLFTPSDDPVAAIRFGGWIGKLRDGDGPDSSDLCLTAGLLHPVVVLHLRRERDVDGYVDSNQTFTSSEVPEQLADALTLNLEGTDGFVDA